MKFQLSTLIISTLFVSHITCDTINEFGCENSGTFTTFTIEQSQNDTVDFKCDEVDSETKLKVKTVMCVFCILQEVPNEVFAQFPNARWVKFSQCHVQRISPEMFENANNVVILSLGANGITEIGKEMFVHAKNLQDLELGYNKIKVIHEDAFKGWQVS